MTMFEWFIAIAGAASMLGSFWLRVQEDRMMAQRSKQIRFRTF